MLFYISPSKTMNLEILEDLPAGPFMIPKTHSDKIRFQMLSYSVSELETFYNVSEKVAIKAYEMLHTRKTGRSLDLFEGLVFKNLDYASLDKKGKLYVDTNLIIASSLYGIVTPTQRIIPYRLDLKNALKVDDESLSRYWNENITETLLKQPSPLIVNLASEEYSQIVDWAHLKREKTVLKIEFKEMKRTKWVSVSTYSKMARGLFIRHAAQTNVQTIEGLKAIKIMDYAVNSELSDAETMVFTR